MNLAVALLGKVRTLGWFLARPRYWGQAVRAARRRLFPHPRQDTRREATEWCRQRSVSTKQALSDLLGEHDWASLASLESDAYALAVDVAAGVPVPMGGPGDLDLLYHLARSGGVERVIETGVAFGWSSLALLLGLGPKGQLFSSDMPYVRGGNEDWVGCVVPEDLRGRWTLLRHADRQALPRALSVLKSVHMCHYDSDKSYVGRMWAYRLLWDALEPGGFFVSDDIADNVAFQEFADAVGLEPIVVRPDEYSDEEKYVGILLKPAVGS